MARYHLDMDTVKVKSIKNKDIGLCDQTLKNISIDLCEIG